MCSVFHFSERGSMDTLNIVLMMVLCVMIGFAIGNIYGKETMKKTFQSVIDNIVKGLKGATTKKED